MRGSHCGAVNEEEELTAALVLFAFFPHRSRPSIYLPTVHKRHSHPPATHTPPQPPMTDAHECASALALLSFEDTAPVPLNVKKKSQQPPTEPPTSVTQTAPAAPNPRGDRYQAGDDLMHHSQSRTRMFVTMISSKATVETLTKYFSRFGAVTKVMKVIWCEI